MALTAYTSLCPHCQAEIDLTQEHMEMADGNIICGNCNNEFHAPDHLLKGFYRPPAKPSPTGPMEAQLPGQSIDEELTLLDRAEQSYEDAPPASPGIGTRAKAPMDERRSRSGFFDLDPLVDGYSRLRRQRKVRTTFSYTMVTILGFFLVLQILWVNYDNWANNDNFRPAYSLLCSFPGYNCALPDYVEAGYVSVDNLGVLRYTDAYELTGQLANDSARAKEFPWFELVLYDREYVPIAGGKFSPAQYMESYEEGQVMPTGQPFTFNFKVDAPAANAVTYKLIPLAAAH